MDVADDAADVQKPSLIIEVHNVKNLPQRGRFFLEFNLLSKTLRTTAKAVTSGPLRTAVFDEAVCFNEPFSVIYHEHLEMRLMQTSTEPGEGVEKGFLSLPLNRCFVNRPVRIQFDLQPIDHITEPAVIDASLELKGSIRPRLRWLVERFFDYSQAVDHGLDMAAEQTSRVAPILGSRWAMVSAVPLSLLAVASLPLVAVVCVAGAPLLLPLLALVLVVSLVAGALFVAVALSSRRGRAKAAKLLEPVTRRLTETSVGQQLLFDTGPLPSIASVAALFVPNDVWGKLAASIAIDAIGSSSYLLPVLGEGADLAWAPMQALLISGMYSKSSPYAAYFGFAEELLPFTDIIPTATLAWIKEYAPQAYGHFRTRVVGARGPEWGEQTG